MKREFHVRFLERPGVRFPRATRQHKLFCHITQTWRGQPLISRQTVVELIASTTTKAGLTVRCELDTGIYPKGIQVSKEEMATLNITATRSTPSGITPSHRGCRLEAIVFGRRLIVLLRGGFLEHLANASRNGIAQFVKARRVSKKNNAGYRQYNKHTSYL
jgi:hypothetical protein